MKELRNRLRSLEPLSSSLDGILLINEGKSIGEGVADPNFFYFTNSDVTGMFFYDFSEAKIITNIMEENRAKKSWIKYVSTEKLGQFIKKIKNKKIGIDATSMSLKNYKNLRGFKKADISKKLMDSRSIKSSSEIKTIRKASEITKKIGAGIEHELSKKLTETELKKIINSRIISAGAEPAFTTIVASGRNSSLPHHVAENQKIAFPVIVDFGVRYKAYCTDVTRTFGSSEENLLGKIFEELEKIIKPGIKTSILDITARRLMGEKEKYFIHSLGHGLGIEVHELPWIQKKSKDVLKEGMFIAIEPGLYNKNGIRIENNYLITKGGFKKTSNF